jgi:hypothetical protein
MGCARRNQFIVLVGAGLVGYAHRSALAVIVETNAVYVALTIEFSVCECCAVGSKVVTGNLQIRLLCSYCTWLVG